jgi:hypothetical protein
MTDDIRLRYEDRSESGRLEWMRHELFDANDAEEVMEQRREAVTPAA